MKLERRHQKRGRVLSAFGLISLALAMLVAGCASESPAPEPEMTTPEPEMTAPRVFFAAPADGATVQSPVTFRFGAENFVIEPVGDGAVHEGAGHHHLGVDTDCMPVGEIIPEGEGWVHFGDASAEIEMQLEPGTHRFCLQIGDGEHRTLEGLEEVISITVAE